MPDCTSNGDRPDLPEPVATLTLRPGDKLAVILPADTPPEILTEFGKTLDERWPDIKWLILTDNIRLARITEAEVSR